MENKKTLYQRIKENIKIAAQVYCFLGAMYGLGMTLNGQTTGHLSADIYTGRRKPTKIERVLCEKVFGINLETKENGEEQ